jgi:hypothetical protein
MKSIISMEVKWLWWWKMRIRWPESVAIREIIMVTAAVKFHWMWMIIVVETIRINFIW